MLKEEKVPDKKKKPAKKKASGALDRKKIKPATKPSKKKMKALGGTQV